MLGRARYVAASTLVLALVAIDFKFSNAEVATDSDEGASAVAGLHRVTDKPYRMSAQASHLCVAPKPTNDPLSPHRELSGPTFCHVYVNEQALLTIRSGEGTYPVGSLIVKEKLASPDSADAMLYTRMKKRPAGYDPTHGDWEYSVADGAGREIATGKIDSCIGCHDSYAETDYVTREYLER